MLDTVMVLRPMQKQAPPRVQLNTERAEPTVVQPFPYSTQVLLLFCWRKAGLFLTDMV